MVTRVALQLIRLALVPLEAAGPSRHRLRLHRVRLRLLGAMGPELFPAVLIGDE